MTQWFLLLTAFVGIILIQGYDERVTINYVLLGALGSLCAAFAYSIIRYLKDKENSLVLMIYFPMIACPICLLYTSPSPRDKRQSRMPSSA